MLFSLYWLPVYYRIHFKILLFTFKAIHGMAPEYICSMIKIKQGGRYNLRSNTEMLLQPPVRLTKKTPGDRAFVSAAPNLWNKLPIGIRRQENFIIFKKQLKSYFFLKSLIIVGDYIFRTHLVSHSFDIVLLY